MTSRPPTKLLLADSDADFRRSVRDLLELAGYQVEEAASPEEAREKLQANRFDLAILEVRLRHAEDSNDVSGLEIAKFATGIGVPCILLTAIQSVELLRFALSRGAKDLITKSSSPQALLDSIARNTRDVWSRRSAASPPSIGSPGMPPTASPPPSDSASIKKHAKPPTASPSAGKTRDASPPPTSMATPPLEEAREPAEEVHFTAIHPKEGSVETWHTLLVYAHIEAALDTVHEDAKRFTDEIDTPKEISAPSSTQLARGTEITIVPACAGMTFNPERASLKWLEDFHRVEFRCRADASLEGDAAKGQITFYVGPLIVGTLKLAMLFDTKDAEPAAPREEHALMYHRDSIFISYSHRDTEVAKAFKTVHEATGHNVLIDIDDLLAGQEWNPALLEMIDKADIFQLFWSENSKASKYCKQEWDYALKRGMEGFIRPVYWQIPLPEPPEELGKFHFEYVEL